MAKLSSLLRSGQSRPRDAILDVTYSSLVAQTASELARGVKPQAIGEREGRPGNMILGRPPRAPKAPSPINQKKPIVKQTNKKPVGVSDSGRNCDRENGDH